MSKAYVTKSLGHSCSKFFLLSPNLVTLGAFRFNDQCAL